MLLYYYHIVPSLSWGSLGSATQNRATLRGRERKQQAVDVTTLGPREIGERERGGEAG